MNSDRQISQDQTSLESTKQYRFNPLFILAAIGVGIVVVKKLFRLFEEDSFASDFPPIIIKSGSFTIETDDDNNSSLKLINNSSPFVYKKTNLPPLKGVRVFRYNEKNGDKDEDSFIDLNGFKVYIWLQYFQNGNWSSLTQPQISIDVNNQALEFILSLKFAKKLKDKKLKKHPKRNASYEDDEPEIFRFGKVELLGKSSTISKTYNDVDDEYIIGFYNF